MDTPDINYVLKLYLGADAKGGFQPIGCNERLRSAFPKDHVRMMNLISPYLIEDRPPQDWSESTLSEEADRFAETLRKKFPELDATTVRALANRWSFSHK